MEAVGFALQTDPSLPVRQTMDGMIREVVAIQEPSGYLNTYYQGDKVKLRMAPGTTQTTGHELYCIGHMLQGAIAYYRATGDKTLLDAGVRFVNDFLLPNYGPGEKQTPIVSGHPEIEMSLVELYRTTGDKRHLDLAGYILQGDKRVTLRRQQVVYMYCGIPFTSRTKLEGHAVRAMHACCGATDYFLETGDPTYWKTLEALWHDLSEHQMYVTGGVGARSEGEAFGEPYELPNARAYGESCAAIGNMMWNWRMLAATGEAKYTDVIERALYNGINSGMSLDGKTYCYRNPLAFDPAGGDKIRNTWYDTTCCPPNIERTMASLPGYFYSAAKDGVYVHLYDNSEMKWKLDSGTALALTQRTNYPWDGNVKLTVAPAKAEEFTVYVRVPGWSKKTTVTVDGKPVSGVTAGEYLALKRRWTGPSVVEMAFDMEPQILRANPAVSDDTGRVAIQRGPIVYCMEGLDQPGADAKAFPLYQARLDGALKPTFEKDKLDGIVLLQHEGRKSSEAQGHGGLYEAAVKAKGTEPASLRLIPYYAWANREPSAMQVWIPVTEV
ncbi:MAG: glycoside hydrolase family 127 protein [Acidobacteriaceae bacterium]